MNKKITKKREKEINKERQDHLLKYAFMYNHLEQTNYDVPQHKKIIKTRKNFYENSSLEDYVKYEEYLGLANIIVDMMLTNQNELIRVVQSDRPYFILVTGSYIEFNTWHHDDYIWVDIFEETPNFTKLLEKIDAVDSEHYLGEQFVHITEREF